MQTIIFVTTVFEEVENGPGVFAKYLWEEFKAVSDFNFIVLAPDVTSDDARIISFVKSDNSGIFYNNMETRLNEFIVSHPNDQFIIHLNIPHSLSRLPASAKSIVQANDYDAAFLSRNIFNAFKNNSFKRFLKLFWRRFREEKIFNQANLVLANSRFTSDMLKAEYGLPINRTRVVYKAVDVDLFTRPQQYAKTNDIGVARGHRAFKLLFVGSNWQRKGLDILFEALSMLITSGKDVEVIVVGPEAFGASAEIKEGIMQSPYADHFQFVGRVTRQHVPAYYWDADLMVLPSRAEALGVAVIESLAAGLPVVATHVGGIPEIIDGHKVGLLVPSEDSKALFDAISTLIDNHALLESMSENAVIRANDFSKRKMLNEIREIYRELFD